MISPKQENQLMLGILALILPVLPAGILNNLMGFSGFDGPFLLFWVAGAVALWNLFEVS